MMEILFGDGALGDFFSSDLYVYQVSREEVEKLEFEKLNEVMDMLKVLGEVARGKLAIIFNGYDHMPDEIYEIEDIRKWCNCLVDHYPEIFYFLTPHFEQNAAMIAACIGDIEVVSLGPALSPIEYAIMGIEPPMKQLTISLSQLLSQKIGKGTIDYGYSIGVHPSIIGDVISSIPGLHPDWAKNLIND